MNKKFYEIFFEKKTKQGQLHRALLLLREDSFAIYDSLGVAQVKMCFHLFCFFKI